MAYKNRTNPLAGLFKVIGQDGLPWAVTQGVGLGIRQHDDVMLSWGYSRKVQVEKDLSADEYLLLELNVNIDTSHHAEARYIEAYGGLAEIWIIPNYVGSVPASPEREIIWNQRGPELVAEIDQKSYFQSWVSATLPIDDDPELDVNRAIWIDHKEIYAVSGKGNNASSADAFAGLKGRYYYPGRHVVLIKAVEACHVHYQYDWHEF